MKNKEYQEALKLCRVNHCCYFKLELFFLFLIIILSSEWLKKIKKTIMHGCLLVLQLKNLEVKNKL
jgi:hypothetical protein